MSFHLQTTADTLEQELRARRMIHPPVAWANELVYPAYANLSLRNVPHTVAALLNHPLPNSTPLDERVWGNESPYGSVQRVIAFLMDGMGYLHLQKLMSEDDELRQIVSDLTDGRGAVPLTSVMPSTTAVALTTLWTGVTPGTSGMTGTLMYLREYSTVGDMLKFSPAVGKHHADEFERWGTVPDKFVPVPGVSEHLTQGGIATHMVLHYMLAGTGLSRILHRGIQHMHSHMGYSDMLLRLHDTLRLTRGQRGYIGMYHPGMDTVAHAYGAHNRYTAHEVKTHLAGIRDLLHDPQVQDGQTIFMLLADHGHYDAPNVINVLTDEKALPLRANQIIGLTGDDRLAYYYARHGGLDTVKRVIENEYADSLTYIEVDDALQAGLYGTENLHPQLRSRLGDLILVPRLGWRVIDPSVIVHKLVSVHAGLDAWEMLIPFLWKRI